ncbi:MAG: trigger factor family protein [Bacteroidales bacterium]|nr:trigger factor family protein [Bacteroidales bacterium]
MKITKKQVDKLNIELTMNIEAADYAEIERKKLAEVRRNADFKGFRKGNVPMSLIQKVYGGQVLADAVNQVVGESLGKYIDDEKLHILGEPLGSENQPEIDWVSGGDFTFIFDLALSPEVNVEVEKADSIVNYTITSSAKEKADMVASMKKYYEGRKEEKTDEDIEKEVAERLEASNKDEAAWRLNKDIRDFYVQKAGIELPEAFLRRWLLHANEGKVTEEQLDKEFPAFLEDFKWQLVRGYLMKKFGFEIEQKDIEEAAKAFVTYQYAMYGIGNVPEDMIAEAVKNVLNDRKQIDRLAEQVEDQKVIAKIKETITLKAKKITSEKFRELK